MVFLELIRIPEMDILSHLKVIKRCDEYPSVAFRFVPLSGSISFDFSFSVGREDSESLSTSDCGIAS